MCERIDLFLMFFVGAVAVTVFDFLFRMNRIRSVKATSYAILFVIFTIFGVSFAGLVSGLSFVFGLWFLSPTGDAAAVVLMFVLLAYVLFKGETAEERMGISSWQLIRRNRRLRASPLHSKDCVDLKVMPIPRRWVRYYEAGEMFGPCPFMS